MCIIQRNRHTAPRAGRPRFRGWESYGTSAPRRAGFHTSPTEILHLAVALVVLTTALTFFIGGVGPGETRRDTGITFPTVAIPDLAIISLITIATGFLLHELMHKFVAQIYGHWAEFRAQAFGLVIPIPLTYLTGIIFAAPGAVIIAGYVQRHQNGIISAAGPLTNLAIGFLALPFTFVVGTTGTFQHTLPVVMVFGNLLLAAFNMLPVSVLDGRKVWQWNKAVFAAIWLLAALLLLLFLFGPRF